MASVSPTVFIVQTEATFAQQASLELKTAGFKPVLLSDARNAWKDFAQQRPSLLLLDLAESKETGKAFCDQVRLSGSRAVILLLLETDTVEQRAACLETGADDYLLKPCLGRELLERVSFYLRPEKTDKERLIFANLVLDLSDRYLSIEQETMTLTIKEFQLLRYLMSHPREVLTRQQILDNVWGNGYKGESNVIEVYIRYLRLKIEKNGKKRMIKTVRGTGYVLQDPV